MSGKHPYRITYGNDDIGSVIYLTDEQVDALMGRKIGYFNLVTDNFKAELGKANIAEVERMLNKPYEMSKERYS
jgi:hypothetical protein